MPWQGLWCNDGGQVVRLDLKWKGLEGTLPTQIGDLTTLNGGFLEDGTYGFLDSNSLAGTLPTEFGRLSLFKYSM